MYMCSQCDEDHQTAEAATYCCQSSSGETDCSNPPQRPALQRVRFEFEQERSVEWERGDLLIEWTDTDGARCYSDGWSLDAAPGEKQAAELLTNELTLAGVI